MKKVLLLFCLNVNGKNSVEGTNEDREEDITISSCMPLGRLLTSWHNS